MPKQNLAGWKKDPHISNETYHRKMSAGVLPPSANNSDLLPKTSNQDFRPGCVGHGVAALCHTEGVKDGAVAKHQPLAFSPWWIWNGARYLEGTLDKDEGVYPTDAFTWLEQYGFLLFKDWPWILNQYGGCALDKTDPTTKDNLSIHYPGFKKMRIDGGVAGIQDALAQRFCVAIGTPWPKAWSEEHNAIWPKVTASTEIDGGHEWLIHTYTDDGLGEALNSWGDWGLVVPFTGMKGGFKFRLEDIEAFKQFFGGYDAFRIEVDMTGGLIPPQPEPQPEPIPVPLHCSCSRMVQKLLNEFTKASGGHGQWKYI